MPPGLLRTGALWSEQNIYVHLSFTFASRHAGKTAKLQLLLHDLLSDGEKPSRFSDVMLSCVHTPVILPPKRLVGSVTWATAALLFDGDSPDGTFRFLDTYAQLGLNTVPSVALRVNGALPIEAPWAYAGNRYVKQRTSNQNANRITLWCDARAKKSGTEKDR